MMTITPSMRFPNERYKDEIKQFNKRSDNINSYIKPILRSST
jgi:hypothetical protein